MLQRLLLLSLTPTVTLHNICAKHGCIFQDSTLLLLLPKIGKLIENKVVRKVHVPNVVTQFSILHKVRCVDL